MPDIKAFAAWRHNTSSVYYAPFTMHLRYQWSSG